MDYNTYKKHLKEIPTTFIPGLLIKLVEIGYEKNVFEKGTASNIVKK